MGDETSDAALIARVGAGDTAAFRELFGRYERRVLGFAYRYLGRYEEAEEVVQEVFMRLYRHARKFDPTRPLAPWLYTIAANACRTRGRQVARAASAALPHDRAAPGRCPRAAASAAEDAAAVAEAIAGLGDEQRLVFVLARYQDLDYPQIARITGAPLGTVKSRMHRAIRTLRNKLGGLLP